ncbi:MAG: SDR family oxidoreductase [Candidatus Sungiibacteriota bacterium]
MFKNKIALITGSTRGIGMAIATSLGMEEATLIIHGQTPTSVERAVKDLGVLGFRAFGFHANFENFSEAQQLVDKVIQKFGRVDILIHNAAVAHSTPMKDITVDEYTKMVAVNLTAPFFITQKLIPYMESGSDGRIIFISSLVGLRGRSSGAVYAATKSALIGLARTLAKELGPFGITVNVVAPGAVVNREGGHKLLTQQQLKMMARVSPLRRVGKPEDIAETVTYLTSKKASFITGEVIIVDGGISLV